MQSLLQDLRYAIRTFARNPGFTAVAVLTLALGIGANTAIFSVVESVLLRPLPYKDPDRLVTIWETDLDEGKVAGPVAPADFVDWRNQSQTLEQMAAVDPLTSFNLTGSGDPERVQGAEVSASFFPLLGVQATMGRTFSPEDDQPGHEPVVVLSHAFWQRRFGADRAVLGQSVKLNEREFTIVGILPPDFQFVTRQADFQFLGREFDLWVPLVLDPSTLQHFRRTHPLRVLARLKPGVSLSQAQEEMDAIARRLEEQHPDIKGGEGVSLIPLQERVVTDVRPALITLMVAVGLILLIACANVANLLLVRAIGRFKEVAIRSALGASRLRIIRQLMLENLLLAGLAGGAGILIAEWAVGSVVALAPEDLPRLGNIGLNRQVLAFAVFISCVTAVVSGLAPAIQASRANLNDSLKADSRTAAGDLQSGRLRHFLVVFGIAMAVMLLAGGGLLLKSLWHLRGVPLGFSPEELLTLRFSLPMAKYRELFHITRFYDELLQRVESLPGVVSAGLINDLPLSGTYNAWNFRIEGRTPLPAGQHMTAQWRVVSPGYFKTMEIPLRRGRAFTDADRTDSPPVAMINQTMGRRFWLGENPVGERIWLSGQFGGWREIIGVVGDVHHFGPMKEPEPEVYVPYMAGNQPWRRVTLVVRTSSDAGTLTGAIRKEILNIDKDQPVYHVQTMEELVSQSVSRSRFMTVLLGIFAVLALILAATGIYSLMSYSVTRRIREIGIRMALGAGRSAILGMVLRQGAALALIGLSLGLAGAFALTRYLESLLFGVMPSDPTTLASVSLLLVAVALLASWIPARRATKVDPMVALRYE